MLLNRVRRLHGTIVSLPKHFLRVNDDDVHGPRQWSRRVRGVILKVFRWTCSRSIRTNPLELFVRKTSASSFYSWHRHWRWPTEAVLSIHFIIFADIRPAIHCFWIPFWFRWFVRMQLRVSIACEIKSCSGLRRERTRTWTCCGGRTSSQTRQTKLNNEKLITPKTKHRRENI